MSLESNHTAAGNAATTARGEVKQEWYKKPTALHFIIATGVILTALVINNSFEFNFFWKLLLGAALVWGGSQLKKTTIDSIKLWGNILRGIGWMVIVIALLNSGARTLIERGIVKTDEVLTDLAAQVETVASTTTGSAAGSAGSPRRLALPDGQIIKVDLRRKEERDPMLVRINITDTVRIQGKVVERSPGRPIGDGKTAYGFCAEIVEPAWLKKSPDAPKQHLMFPNPRHIGLSHDMKPTDEMRKFLVQNEVTSVTVSVYSILTVVGIQGKC